MTRIARLKRNMQRATVPLAAVRRGARAVATVVALIAAAQPAARAEQPTSAPTEANPDAREQFRIAERHFTLGAFAEALAHYRRAFALQPLPGLLFNIAQCYRNLGDCRQSVFYYRRYLAAEPVSPYADEVQRIIAECRAQPATQPAAQTTRPTPAASRTRPTPASRPTAVATARRAPANTVNPRRRRVLLWTGLGLTGSFALVGAIAGGLALGKNDSFRDPATPDARRPELKTSGQNLATAANICFALAGTAAAATALVYWLHRPRSTGRVVGVLAPQPGGAVLSVGGRL